MPLHIFDSVDDQVSVVASDIADGAEATPTRTYRVTNIFIPYSMTFDGTNIHVFNFNDNTFHVFAPNHTSGTAADRTYTITGVTNAAGMAFDGTNLHIVEDNSDDIRVIAPNTENGKAATVIRTYSVTGLDNATGMTFDGTNLHIADILDDNIRVIAPNTANNGTATILRTYSITGLNQAEGLAFDGTNIHASDGDDDNIRVFAPDSNTILRTYTVSGITSGQAMTYVPPANIAPNFANNSYTFTNVALAVNTVVGTITATDANTGDTLTYSLTGADASKFSVNANTGQITVATALTYSQSYSFTIEVSDSALTDTAMVSVLAIANTAPVFSQATYTFNNVAITTNAVVGTVAAVDTDTLTYSLTGTDMSSFAISNTGQITVATALMNSQAYTFNVVADDSLTTTSVPVTVNTVAPAQQPNNAPVFGQISYTFNNVAIAIGSVAGTVTATDADVGDTISYSLTGVDASNFTIDSNGQITVSTVLTNSQSYSFNAVADDQTDTISVMVTVNAIAGTTPQATEDTALENTYDEDLGYNVLPDAFGKLKRVETAGTVSDLGNTWFTDRPYNVSANRMLSIGDDLHLVVGYGNTDSILRYNSQASQSDNFVHIIFGKALKYVLPEFTPDSNVHSELSDLAKRVNATLSFEKSIIRIADRSPFRALTNGATGTDTTNIAYNTQNKAFPTSGWVLIDEEIIRYTGRASGAFTGITRGVLGTSITNHLDNARILYLDNIIESTYKRINLASDTNRLKNIIRDSNRTAEVRDSTSIATFSEQPFTLDLSLDRHQTQWLESVFQEYLQELKGLQDIVSIQIRQDFSLQLGEVVPFIDNGTLKAMRVISITYEQADTNIRGRTITL